MDFILWQKFMRINLHGELTGKGIKNEPAWQSAHRHF